MLKYCRGRYKTQKTFDKVVNACLAALKFLIAFITKKMLLKLNNAELSNNDM